MVMSVMQYFLPQTIGSIIAARNTVLYCRKQVLFRHEQEHNVSEDKLTISWNMTFKWAVLDVREIYASGIYY